MNVSKSETFGIEILTLVYIMYLTLGELRRVVAVTRVIPLELS